MHLRKSTRRQVQLAILLASCAPLVPMANNRALATEFSWQNAGGGSWNDSGNWLPAGPPGSTDNADFGLSGSYQVALSSSVQVGGVYVNQGDVALGLANNTLSLASNLYVGGANPASLTLATSGTLSAADEYIGYTGGYYSGTLTQSNGVNSISGTLHVGFGGAGTYALSGGTLSAGTEIISYSGSPFTQTGGVNYVGTLTENATYTLGGGTLNSTIENGNGGFLQNGGVHTVISSTSFATYTMNAGIFTAGSGSLTSSLWINGGTTTFSGSLVSGTGYVYLNGGSLNVGSINANVSFLTGSLNISGSGASTFTNNVSLGNTVGGGSSTLNLTGGGTLNAPTITFAADPGNNVTVNQSNGYLKASYEYIGHAGNTASTGVSTFNQSGGINAPTQYLYVYNRGIYNLSNGTLTAQNEVIAGSFPQTGGSHTASILEVDGSYTLSAGTLSTNYDHIAFLGAGSFTQTGGYHNASGDIQIADTSSGGRQTGTFTLGAGTLTANTLGVGYAGNGYFTQNGGVASFSSMAVGGNFSEGIGAGICTLTNGSFSVGNGFSHVGGVGTGVFNQQGGSSSFGATLYVGGDAGGFGTFNLSAGTLNAGSFAVGDNDFYPTGYGVFTIASGAAANLTGTLKVWNSAGSSINLAGTLAVGTLDASQNPSRFNWTAGTLNFPTGGLSIAPGGGLGSTLRLSAGKTLSASGTATIASGGALDSTGGLFAAPSIVVASNGTLSGAGTVNGALDIAGTIAPGDQTQPGNGSMSINSTLTLEPGSSMLVRAGASSSDEIFLMPGVGPEVLSLSGASLIVQQQYPVILGHKYKIIDASNDPLTNPFSGTFASLNSLPSGADYVVDVDQANKEVDIIFSTYTPEPATTLLMGAMGFLALRRCRGKRCHGRRPWGR